MKFSETGHRFLRYLPVVLWVLFTSALAGWWYLFSLQLLRGIVSGTPVSPAELQRHFIMLTWEGAVLVASIVGGGATLTYFMIREMRERDRMRTFLSTFTHELKTPLASIRLQAESLEEDLNDPALKPLVRRLVGATGRLSTQLENSLLLAAFENYTLFSENLDLQRLLHEIATSHAVAIECTGQAIVHGDARACRSVFDNIIGNAAVHGRASLIKAKLTSDAGKVAVELHDNGRGFKGNRALLALLFARPTPESGNGIGLSLARRFVERMGGSLEFPESSDGFVVRVVLPQPGLVTEVRTEGNS